MGIAHTLAVKISITDHIDRKFISIRNITMNKISPKKLLHSKWTAVKPVNKEKHFCVVEVEFDEQGNVIQCLIEAVYNQNQYDIHWRDLTDPQVWRVGWQ